MANHQILRHSLWCRLYRKTYIITSSLFLLNAFGGRVLRFLHSCMYLQINNKSINSIEVGLLFIITCLRLPQKYCMFKWITLQILTRFGHTRSQNQSLALIYTMNRKLKRMKVFESKAPSQELFGLLDFVGTLGIPKMRGLNRELRIPRKSIS